LKYSFRTIKWKFQDTNELLPEIADLKAVYVRSPEDVVKGYQSLFIGRVCERFIVFWLSASNKVIGFEIISEGILNSSLVHPREVFRGSIVATAASIICAHNHPSENPEPSSEDLAITKQIVEAGKIVGIPVHDHIIFAGKSYTSLAERGLI